MPRRREREDGERSSSSSDEDALEQALIAPRYVSHERVVAGQKVSYSRHVLYAPDDDGGISAMLHDLPLRDKRHDNVSLVGLDRGPVPDPYAEAGYADMDEQPEAVGQFHEFIRGPALSGIMANRPRPGTAAAHGRIEAQAADLALRRQVDEATRRATVGNDALVSLDWARIVPPPLLPPFLRDAAPVLAVLLPMLSRHKADVIHETLASWQDAMSAAGCTFDRVTEHCLAGHIGQYIAAAGQTASHEPFVPDRPPTNTHIAATTKRGCAK